MCLYKRVIKCNFILNTNALQVNYFLIHKLKNSMKKLFGLATTLTFCAAMFLFTGSTISTDSVSVEEIEYASSGLQCESYSTHNCLTDEGSQIPRRKHKD